MDVENQEEAQSAWGQVLEALREQVPAPTFATYLQETEGHVLDAAGGVLQVVCPSAWVAQAIEQRLYGSVAKQAERAVGGPGGGVLRHQGRGVGALCWCRAGRRTLEWRQGFDLPHHPEVTMTTGPMDTPDPEATEKLLANMAQQVAQQSRTTALHISQHDDIEAAARERANAVIEGIRADLEAAHQAALARATEALTASHRRELHRSLTGIAERFNDRLQELTDHHASILKGHVDALEELGKQSAERHGREVEELRSEIENSRGQAQRQRQEMDEAHAANLAATDSALRQEREEQQTTIPGNLLPAPPPRLGDCWRRHWRRTPGTPTGSWRKPGLRWPGRGGMPRRPWRPATPDGVG